MLTCIVLAILANSSPSDIVALRERVLRDIVDAGGGVAVAATGLAGEAVLCAPVPPRLVIVGGETGLTVWSNGVVFTLANSVNLVTAPTCVTIASTPE